MAQTGRRILATLSIASFISILFIILRINPFHLHYSLTQSFSGIPAGKKISVNCTIRDSSGAILRKFAFNRCLYLQDGGMIASTLKSKELIRFDKYGIKVWSLKFNIHHMINLNSEQNLLTAFDSEDISWKGKLVRADILHLIRVKDGKIMQTWHLRDHLSEILGTFVMKEDNLWKIEPSNTPSKAQAEVSHLNSAYFVEKNALSNRNPAFRVGNIIITTHGPLGKIAILDPNIQKILWVSENRYLAHDAQVASDGSILFFQNNYDGKSLSRLVKIAHSNEEVLWTYSGQAGKTFFSDSHGVVQEFPGSIYFFSDNTLATQGILSLNLIDKEGNLIWKYEEKMQNFANDNSAEVVNAKLLDLDDFLKNNLN